LGRCEDTVLSWLRRFTAATALVRVVFTRLLVAVDPDPPLIGTADSPLADAVTAILACSRAIACRWQVSMVSPWSVVSAVTDGTLLSPQISLRSINTSSPLPINDH
jgi:hypothetical protein